MGKFIDLTGQKFGHLTVLRRAENKVYKNGAIIARFECLCDCGKVITTNAQSLRDGRAVSCGCARSKLFTAKHINQKHGGSGTRLFRVWMGMNERCNSPNHNRYRHYGGRGISVCNEWHNDYSAFRDWAITAGYDETAPRGKCTIDRIDVNGSYCPENCRWVDMAEQSKNKRKKGTK